MLWCPDFSGEIGPDQPEFVFTVHQGRQEASCFEVRQKRTLMTMNSSEKRLLHLCEANSQLSRQNIFNANRQGPYPHSRRMIDRVGDSRSHAYKCDLAQPFDAKRINVWIHLIYKMGL